MRRTPLFQDRREAGVELAGRLRSEVEQDALQTLILALPRGGVPVAYEVARALHTELDVFVVRKLGVPGQEELAMGAIATGGVRLLDGLLIDALRLEMPDVERLVREEQAELERRERAYRGDRPQARIRGRRVILVDDGLATGWTMRAACAAVRQREPARIVIAVPVAPADTCRALEREADRIICAHVPDPFSSVGIWYRNFAQTSDAEVNALLRQAHEDVQLD